MEDFTATIPGNLSVGSRPYYPLGAVVPGYVVNSLSTPALLASFVVGCAVIITSAYAIVQKRRPGLPRGELTTALWFVLCGFIHSFFEDHPLRYPLQVIISLGQLYGDVLYYATNIFYGAVSGLAFCRPEAVYFWAYYVLMNAFWIVISFFLTVQSMRQTAMLLSRLKELERGQSKKNI